MALSETAENLGNLNFSFPTNSAMKSRADVTSHSFFEQKEDLEQIIFFRKPCGLVGRRASKKKKGEEEFQRDGNRDKGARQWRRNPLSGEAIPPSIAVALSDLLFPSTLHRQRRERPALCVSGRPSWTRARPKGPIPSDAQN